MGDPQVTMGLQVVVIRDLDDLGYLHDFGNLHSACIYIYDIYNINTCSSAHRV
jgi:hypothetical protein